MKRQAFASVGLAAVMAMSMTAPAFASETGSKSVTDDSGSAVINVTGDIAKDNAADDATTSCNVNIAWTMQDGDYTIDGDTYHWDSENKKYVRNSNGQGTSVKFGEPAKTEITVTNQSNADMSYDIAYAPTPGIDASEDHEGSTTKGTLESYITKNNIDVTQDQSGAASLDYSGSGYTADSATYKGTVSLNSYTADSYPVNAKTFGTCTVTFNEAPATTTGITLNRTEATLDWMTTTAQLWVTSVAPEGASSDVTWSSSDPNVATVDENGTILAMANGIATITATSTANPATTATCNVTVENFSYTATGSESAVNRTLRLSEVGDIGESLEVNGELYELYPQIAGLTVGWDWNDANAFVDALNAADYNGWTTWTLLPYSTVHDDEYELDSVVREAGLHCAWSSKQEAHRIAYCWNAVDHGWIEMDMNTSDDEMGFIVVADTGIHGE